MVPDKAILWAVGNDRLKAIRDQKNYDLIVVLAALKVPPPDQNGEIHYVCGVASVHLGSTFARGYFDGTSSLDVDTSDSGTNWVVIVSQQCKTDEYVAAHEVGHLFGGTHAITTSEGDPYVGVVSQEKANAWRDSGCVFGTLLVSYDDDCNPYFHMDIYSRPESEYFEFGGNYNHYNELTILKTMRSMAAYRPAEGPPPPSPPSQPAPLPVGCGPQTPVGVGGGLVKLCGGGGAVPYYTEHLIWWGDTCPDATAFYQVWAYQAGALYHAFDSYYPTTPGFVYGADADVRVSACDLETCSPLSSSHYYAIWGC